jgi:cation diffusion facilitator CzcD-associated flavoprotein CzcO
MVSREAVVKEALSKGMSFDTHNQDVKQFAKLQMDLPLSVSEIKKFSSVENVCIIGGGVAGVVTARILKDEGIPCTLFEKTGSLGGVWSNNYTGFGIQVPSSLYEFPDKPHPPGWDFAAGEMINKYINDYAQAHGVHEVARLDTSVLNVVRTKGPPDSKFTVTVENEGKTEDLEFDCVIVATGVYSSTDKFIPEYPGADKFQGTIMHSVDYKDIHMCKGKHVVTVGYGKSAFDCAQFSSKTGASSTILYRSTHWPVPRKILGLVPFEFATFSRFGGGVLLPKYPKAGIFETICHGIPGFLQGFWWLVARIFSWQFGLTSMQGGKVNLEPENGFIEDFWGGHGVIPHPDFFTWVNNGTITPIKASIKEYNAKTITLTNGEEIPADVILFGTGFKQSLPFLPEELAKKTEDDGLWLYRNMVHPEWPNLIFLNSNTTTFTNITTAAIQARWVCEALSGRAPLPSADEMDREIAIQKKWKRENMPNAGKARAYMMQTHQVHYYDELLKDMGANIRRKRGPLRALKEIFMPYTPSDYGSIVTGAFREQLKDDEFCGPKAAQPSFMKEALIFVIFVVFLYIFNKVFMTGLSAVFFGGSQDCA